MTRIRAITSPAGLDADQRAVYQRVAASRGAVGGPFTVLLHRPELASAAEALGGYLRYRAPLDARVREAVILAVAGLLRCEFERSAHLDLGRRAGLSAAELEALAAGRADGIAGDAGIAVAFAHALVVEQRVGDALFARARARWDEATLVDLVSLVGYYAFLAAVLNAFEVSP